MRSSIQGTDVEVTKSKVKTKTFKIGKNTCRSQFFDRQRYKFNCRNIAFRCLKKGKV